MALFKIHEGAAANLNTAAPVKYANKGFAYFTKDDGKFYIDVSGNGSTIATIRDAAHPNGNRVPLNAYKSDIATLANFANVSSRIAFGTCTTAANETNKIVNIDLTELDNLQSGSMIAVYFLNENTAKNPQLSIDTVLYPIQYNYTNAVGTTPYSAWSAGSVKIFTYMAADNANKPGKFVLTNPSLDVNSAKNFNFHSINYLVQTTSSSGQTLTAGWHKICHLETNSGTGGGSIILNFRAQSYPTGFSPLSGTILINTRANEEPSIVQLSKNANSNVLDQFALVNLKHQTTENASTYGKYDLYIHVKSTIATGANETVKYLPGQWLEIISNGIIAKDYQNIANNTGLINLEDGYPDLNIAVYPFEFSSHQIATLDSIETGALTFSKRVPRVKATSTAGSISIYSSPLSDTLGIGGYDLKNGSSSLALIRFDSTDATIDAIRPFKINLNPAQDETYSLGTSSLKWKNLYAANVYGDGSELTNLNASNLTSGTVAIARLPSASTTAKGIVQLNDTTSSTSTTIAATANAVKTAYDLAVVANTAANTDKYWANIKISNTSAVNTEPSFKTITITDNGANAHVQFSRTNAPSYLVFPNNASIRLSTAVGENDLYHFDSNYLDLLNDTYIRKVFSTTAAQPLIYAKANSNNITTPIIFINGQNVNSSILRIAANAAINSTYYGFDLSYLGANSGINNSLQLTADNSNQDTKKIAFIINQNGQIGFGASPNTDNQIAVEGNGYFNGDVTATSFLGNGANLTNLNASNISSGTLNVNRLPSSGVTAKAYGPNANIAPGYSNAFNVPYITVDAKGRITAATNIAVTLPPEVTLQSLGLTNAMHFIGKATVNITDGSTANPNITNYDFSKKQPGDVIIDSNNNYEYVWTTANKWERLGPDGSYKVIQSNINTAATGVNQWASQINQNENGEINVTYSSLNTAGIWSGVSNRAIGANISTNPNSIAYYTNATGTFGSIATTSGAFYATAANTVPSFGILPIVYGGTNAANARDAANNLQVASLANGISIPNTADLDTYTTPGNFYCSTSNNAKLIKHTPGFNETTLVNDDFVAFTMKVGLSSGTSYPYQEIKVYSTGVRWYRYFKSTTEEWQSWHEFSDTKVTQSNTNATAYRKVLLSYQGDNAAGAASTTDTNVVYKTPLLEYLPSQGRLFATGVSGKNMEYTAQRGNYSISMGFGTSDTNHGLYSWVKNDWMIFADINGTVRVKGSTDTLTTGRTLKVNLASTSASTAFNGSANITDIGISGILGVANGGTGNNSYTKDALIYATTATKFASYSSTIGGTKKLWYLNAGVPTDSDETVGNNEKPVYLNAGTITAGLPVWTLTNPTQFAENESFNDKTTIGNYYISANSVANTIPDEGKPGTGSIYGTLKVSKMFTGTTNANYLRQDWFAHSSAKYFTRRTGSTGNWSGWSAYAYIPPDTTTQKPADIGSTEQPIYAKATGELTPTAYYLKANIESGTQNRATYYSDIRKIEDAGSIYMDASHITINGTAIPVNSGAFQVIGTSTMRTILPETHGSYSIGDTSAHWGPGYFNTFYISNDVNFKYVAKNGDVAAHFEGNGLYLNKTDLRIYQDENIISARLYLHTLGTTSAAGVSMLELGNNIATTEENNSSGTLRLYSPNSGYMSIKASTVVRNHMHYLPIYSTATDTSSAVYYGRLAGIYKSTTVGDSNFNDVGSTSQPVYVTANGVIKPLSDTVGAENQPVYLNAGTITAGNPVISIYNSNLDFTDTNPNPGVYPLTTTHPVTEVAEYGSVISMAKREGISGTGFDAQMIISSASGSAEHHVYVRRLTSAPAWLRWTKVLTEHDVTAKTTSLTFGSTSTIATINGNDIKVTMPTNPNSDTKVNVTLATTTKAYLLGTSTTPTSTATGVTAIADTGVYLDTTAGKLTATSFAGSGANLTSLNGSNISSGTVAVARLPVMTSASADAAGTAGIVPAPAKGKQTSFLRGDGTWVVPTNTTYSAGTGLSLSSTTFSLATSGVTANSYGPSANAEPGYGATFNVPYITVDAYGRITAASNKSVKIPATDNTDTKNTAGSTDTSDKIYLIGATSQVTNSQTYSDNQVYVTSGTLTTNKVETQGVYVGTSETTAERRVQINTVAGSLYLYSGAAVTANRGLYIRNAENDATYGFSFDQNNAFNAIAKFAVPILPATTSSVNFGSTALHWHYGFFDNIYVSANADYNSSTANAPGVTILNDGGIRITTSNPGYTTIRSASTAKNSSAAMYFPNYNGTGYLIHAASSTAVGSNTQPVYIAANGRVTAITGAIDNDINGNANSATQLKTARYFSITGGATANAVSFNGQANVTLTVTSLDATKLNGTIPIGNLPQGALERLVVVANQTARFALTTSNVQLGDVVKQTDTGVMYYVKDETKLNSAAGYEMFKAGEAASVDWSNINNKPNVSSPTAAGTGIEYISNVSQNAGVITASKSTVRSASTSQTGVVQLSSATNSTSETLAATAKAVKTAYDLANNHKYWANIEATSAAAYNKTPEVANIKINGNTSATTASANNVQLVYDSNLEILNFVFS